MAKAAKASDSKQGLIISLVFSVLINIALGVFVYLGYSGQKELDEAAKKATQDKQNIEADREWQKGQNLILKAYVGGIFTKAEEEELATLRGKWEQSGFKAPAGKEEFDKLVQKLDAEYKWDPNNKKPVENLLRRVERLNAELVTEQNRMAAFEKKSAATEQKNANLSAAMQQDVQKRQKEVEGLNDKFVKLQAAKAKEFLDAKDQVEKLQNEVDGLNKKVADAKNETDQQFEKLQREGKNKDLKYQQLQSQVKPIDWTAHDQPKGRITAFDRSGGMAYINLGSRDLVKPQLTFSVFGKDAGGKPVGERKGAVEVVNVLGPTLSMAKVTEVTDAATHPLVRGDLLFNPAWSPTLREHVAVAGLIDLTGDGSDASAEFVRDLRRQNIVVDMYLDLKSMTVQGKLTHQTGYLVLGTKPQFGSGITLNELNNDPQNQRRQDVIAKLSDIESEATKLGVAVVPARWFMALIGYKLPKSAVPPDYTLRAPSQRPAGDAADADKKAEDKPDAKDEKKDAKDDKKDKEEK
jgi:hypothetical protein